MTKAREAALCGNAARDPSTGKAAKKPHARTCERELGHAGPHRIGPRGEFEHVVEWTDDKLGWVAFNRKFQGANAPKAKDMGKKKAPTTNIPHEAGCGCGPCHNERTHERTTKAQKLPPEACGVPDGDRGRGCAYKKGHDGYHFTGMRIFRDAAPPVAKPKKTRELPSSATRKAAPVEEPKIESKKTDPRCASKQMSDRCDLPTGHYGAHLARVNGPTGAQVKTWNASESNDWPCCTVKSAGTPQIQCHRPDEHSGGHRALVRRAGGIEIAVWQGDTATKVTMVGLHDAAAQLLASKLDRAGRPADAAPAASRPMTLDDEPEDPEADEAAVAAMDAQGRDEIGDTNVIARADSEDDTYGASDEDPVPPASGDGGRDESSESADIQTGRASGLEHPPARLFGRRRHAAGALWSFADLQGDDFDKVVANLKERDAAARDAGVGDDQALISAIVLVEVENEDGATEKFILDGWNRARCCESAGVRPRFVMYSGATDIDTLIKYTDAVNDKRRHMTSSQRAAFAAEANVLRLKQGNSAARSDGSAKTQVQRARELGTTDRQIRRAEAVKEQVAPKVWEAVKAGKVPLEAAKQAIGMPVAEQTELAEQALAGNKEMKAGKFSALVRQSKKRELVAKINTGRVAPMPMGPFGVIYGDYPWHFDNSDQHEGSRGHLGYPTMKTDEIIAHAIETAKRAASDCVIALWVTNHHLIRGDLAQVIKAYGAEPRTLFTWPKPRMGVGSWGRGQTEHLAIASIGNPAHTLNEISTLLESFALREHSRKPDEVADLLVKHCGGPFLELFAREQREPWVPWGVEADGSDAITITAKPKSKIYTPTDALVAGTTAA